MQAQTTATTRQAQRKAPTYRPDPIRLLDEDYDEIFGQVDLSSCDSVARLGCGGTRWIGHLDD